MTDDVITRARGCVLRWQSLYDLVALAESQAKTLAEIRALAVPFHDIGDTTTRHRTGPAARWGASVEGVELTNQQLAESLAVAANASESQKGYGELYCRLTDDAGPDWVDATDIGDWQASR